MVSFPASGHIVGVERAALVLFGDVRHQAQIVFDEGVARLAVAFSHTADVFRFLSGGQGLGERASSRNM